MLRAFCICVIITLSISCKKQMCDGNCAPISISGRVVDSSNRSGIPGVPIKIYWQDLGLCYICPEIDVAESKTDNDGNFSFTISIDSLQFGGHGLFVSATIPRGYIPDGYLVEFLPAYVPSFNNIRFVLFQKTDLSIQLVRTQNDNFTSLDLHYYYNFTHSGLYSYMGSPPTAIESFNVATAANVFTKIVLTKAYGFGQTSTFTDSIKCKSNSLNKIVVNY